MRLHITRKKKADELVIARKELIFQNEEKEKRAEELIIANKELAFQNEEKEKRAEELIIADKELAFQNKEKEKRAEELIIADKELVFQNEEKEKRAEELIILNKELVFQNEEKEKRSAELIIANHELKKVEGKISKANRLYSFISHINQTIVHVKNEQALFNKACEIATEQGKFKLAWIGMVDMERNKINLLEQCGILPEEVNRFADTPYEKDGPQDYVLRSGNYYICNNIEADIELIKWKPFASLYQILSCMVLPIKKGGVIIGTFNLYSTEVGFFDTLEVQMLKEAVGDISFGLEVFENEKQRIKALENLIQSENRFRALIEKSTDMKTLISQDGTLMYSSPSIEKVLGYSSEELNNMLIFDVIHKDDLPGFIEKRNEILQTPGNSFYIQIRFQHKKGNWVWCEGTVTNSIQESGINAFVSNFRDISEKKMTEKQQEFDRNNLKALINNTNDLMWSVDKDFRLITSNKQFDELAEFKSGSAVIPGGNILSPGFTPEELDRFKKFYERAFSGETFTEIEYADTPFEIWSEISFYPICKEDEVIGTACYSHDITKRKLAERERIKITNDLIQRNKDLEQFSYIVSHNLRAPVANIIGLSAAVQDKTLGIDIQEELMEGLSHSAKKLDDVIVDLNNILQTKQDVSQKNEMVYFSKIANDIHSSIESLIEKEKAILLWDFSEVDKMITLKSYLHSIFYNLISNSLKYRRPNIPPVIEIKSRKPKDKIELLFKDNGIGIDLEKTGHQVFGLYKRFHAQSTEGRGMGLYMVKTQVEAIGGKISISSEVNKGTEFKIEFAT